MLILYTMVFGYRWACLKSFRRKVLMRDIMCQTLNIPRDIRQTLKNVAGQIVFHWPKILISYRFAKMQKIYHLRILDIHVRK